MRKIPVKVSAIGAQPATHIRYSFESLAYINFIFDNGLAAHIHVSWLSPVKVRQTIIGGSEKMIVYNDLEPDSPVKLFDKGIKPRTAEEHMICSCSIEAATCTHLKWTKRKPWER